MSVPGLLHCYSILTRRFAPRLASQHRIKAVPKQYVPHTLTLKSNLSSYISILNYFPSSTSLLPLKYHSIKSPTEYLTHLLTLGYFKSSWALIVRFKLNDINDAIKSSADINLTKGKNYFTNTPFTNGDRHTNL